MTSRELEQIQELRDRHEWVIYPYGGRVYARRRRGGKTEQLDGGSATVLGIQLADAAFGDVFATVMAKSAAS